MVNLSKSIILIDEFFIYNSKSLENKRNILFIIDVIEENDKNTNQGETSAACNNILDNIVVQKTLSEVEVLSFGLHCGNYLSYS
jgi:hypothetical protein